LAVDLFSRLFAVPGLQNFQGKAGRYRGQATAHLYADFDGFKTFLGRGSGGGGLLDVPVSHISILLATPFYLCSVVDLDYAILVPIA
jgi:hypothetical protein